MLGCGCIWTSSWSTDAGAAEDSHPKFTTSFFYFASIAKVDTRGIIFGVIGPRFIWRRRADYGGY
jgi:drug/metabolite transporter (DMT)-like permease